MSRSKEIWRTKDGRLLRIGDMNDRHLINAINLIRRKRGTCLSHPQLLEEAEYRGLTDELCDKKNNAHRMYHVIQKVCPCIKEKP